MADITDTTAVPAGPPPKVKMSSIREKFPMYADVPDDQLLIALHKKHYSDMPAGQFFQSIDFDTQRQKYLREAAAEMNPIERGFANWSAGYGNLTQGIQQLLGKVGIGQGVSDEEIEAKRERDAILAESLPHGKGWSTGKMLQTTSEALPLAALPATALEAPLTPLVGPTTRMLGASSAISGAGAALSPVTSTESRPANMAVAAGAGLLLPAGGKAAEGAVRGGYKLLTQAGARERALQNIAGHLGENAPRFLENLRTYESPTLKGQAVDVPVTATQASGDNYMAQLEAASRSRPGTQPGWADFDAAQNAQRYQLLENLTPSELRMQRLGRARELATAPQRQGALGTAATAPVDPVMPVAQHVQSVLAGDTSANPAVRTVGNYVMGELGDNATPGRLYEVRKVLAAKLSGPSAIGDELSAATKGAQRETMGMIQSIDDALDQASGGQWRPYLQSYGQRSEPITSGRALRQTMEQLQRKPYKGITPEVTYAGLEGITRRQGQGKFGSKFTAQDEQDIANLVEHLRRSEAPARTRKSAATMGGGSITNTDQMLANLAARMIEGVPMVGGYAKRVREFNAPQVDEQLAQLLQNPNVLRQTLQEFLDRPESRASVVNVLRSPLALPYTRGQ